MIRLREIQDALMQVVGWRQDYNPQKKLDASLVVSESGLTYQGAHPLVTLENLRNIVPDDYFYNYPLWRNGTYYHKGDVVHRVINGTAIVFEALSTSINVAPDRAQVGTPGYPWGYYDYFSDWLEGLTREGVSTAIQNFIQTKQLHKETRNLLERRTFFDGAARLAATIDPHSKIVGFEIVPVRAMGVTTKIERIGLQMTGATGNVRIYVFHSSQVAPVRILNFEYTNTKGAFQWFVPDEPLYLPYISSDTDAGGAWFLCYNQDELPEGMRALNVSKDWSVEPCQTCLGGSIEGWRQMTKYMQVSPFATRAPQGYEDNPEMFDIGMLSYTNTMNYGLNCEVSVGCDLTDFIISQRAIFANVLQKQVAATALRTIAMNPDVRVNRNQVNVTREQMLYELDGNPQGRPSGLALELAEAYKALELDTRGLDRICLQCNNGGVRYRTA